MIDHDDQWSGGWNRLRSFLRDLTFTETMIWTCSTRSLPPLSHTSYDQIDFISSLWSCVHVNHAEKTLKPSLLNLLPSSSHVELSSHVWVTMIHTCRNGMSFVLNLLLILSRLRRLDICTFFSFFLLFSSSRVAPCFWLPCLLPRSAMLILAYLCIECILCAQKMLLSCNWAGPTLLRPFRCLFFLFSNFPDRDARCR